MVGLAVAPVGRLGGQVFGVEVNRFPAILSLNIAM